MVEHWQYLVGNLAVVALFISAWVHGQFVLAGRPKVVRDAAFGLIMGLGAMASMAMSIQIQPGVLFDLRTSVIAIASFFGGPVAGIIAPGGVLHASQPLPELERLAPPDPKDLPNNHLMYAGQWFFFALTALVIYVLALRKRWRGQADALK